MFRRQFPLAEAARWRLQAGTLWSPAAAAASAAPSPARSPRAGAAVTVIGRSEAPLRQAVAAGDAAGFEVADVTDAAQIEQAA